ncbi:SET domain-containing protein [Sparassis crispa]|uniref:SET domain-containing protein n=1 Tax=Sparassis crispa TaxID=139825 RepID=A0A401GZA6_9APHY|nr:SET domain-containing protein [Sparassis crispa]GBE87482.1 SET domain-containing protein [Sparassis crispa]
MDPTGPEPEIVIEFRTWLLQNGARLHPDVLFATVPSGFSVIAREDIPADTTIVSCPFSLAITPELSKRALNELIRSSGPTNTLDEWSERQLICAYICMHWVFGQSSSPLVLGHWPYLNTLPSPTKLFTPLHFRTSELEALKGSNLFGATLDRQRDWRAEWTQCHTATMSANSAWGNEFTWERYLTASTYLSSRAFPSALLSTNPSLVSTPSSHPVLLPGIDSLNHARALPVSWVVSWAHAPDEKEISLVLHNSTPRGSELCNNYGPKPNAELILGYGFSLPQNPDDTIVLKIGGAAPAPTPNQNALQTKFEVGRRARGAEPVWDAILGAVREGAGPDDDDVDVEDELYAAEMLGMAQDLLARLPSSPSAEAGSIRPEVAVMLEHYLEGQRDILQSLIQFAQDMEMHALEDAKEQGLDLVEEGDEEEHE